MEKAQKKPKKKLSSSQIIIMGFAALILAGALLLLLPFSTADGKGASISDALFTATSAVCVTGLVVQDTATYWSPFGQAVLLALIQVGGLGIITMAIAVSLVSGKRISLRQRAVMQDAISAQQVGGIIRIVGFALRMTLIFEAIGAACLAPAMIRDFGVGRGIWYSFFHSISAFCNAGFDLMGVREPFSSFTGYAASPSVNLTLIMLIIIGGIGFFVWDDVKTNKFRAKRYRMQTKVVLVTSLILIVLPALYLFFFEMNELPLGERIFASIFQSVTLRTAGFNTADLSKIGGPGLVIMILMMLVGGSPGSTAGGMKTTTLAVLFSTLISVFRRKEETTFFGRRIENEVVRSAVALLILYLTLCIGGAVVISLVEDLPILTCLFETASAVGTVGLTLGITPALGLASRIILILLMYLGRVGGLTIIFAAIRADLRASQFPKEKLTVG